LIASDKGLDPVVILARIDGVDDVLEERLGRHQTARLVNHPLDRLTGELLDEHPLRRDDQRRGIGDLGFVVAEQYDQQDHHE
jgi:hypothetical protein